MSDLGIGKLIVTPQNRDAVHMAVAPVVAWRTINPCEHIGLKEGDKPIGIADPFLKKPVIAGQTFWMFMYWNSIQNLRHEWDHPAFKTTFESPKPQVSSERNAAEVAIKSVASQCDVTVKELMEAARDFIDSGDTTERKDSEHEYVSWADFWKNYKIVTLCEIEDKYSDPFYTPCC